MNNMTFTLDSIRDIRLYQRERGYRFSLDALLLFDFVRKNSKIQKIQIDKNQKNKNVFPKIVDLGAGSGVIGLLLAKEKKYEKAAVWLVELQEGLFSLACRNIALNGLEDRVTAVKADISSIREAESKGFEKGGFDIVVSNPPFRKVLSGRVCPDEEKAAARHELRMSLPALVKAAGYLARTRGRFFMVYHPERLLELADALREGGFEPKRLRFVHGRRGLSAKIALVESVKDGSPGLSVEEPLFVHDDGGYTPEISRIYEL